MFVFSDFMRRSSETILAAGQDDVLSDAILNAAALCAAALADGAPILVCGNGGSAADAMHIEGELVGRFRRERRGLNVIALPSNAATLTAWANDYDFESVFARQVEAYGRPGGVLIGLSTSGNSANVVCAAQAARNADMRVVALTGAGGGALARHADVLIAAPSADTPMVQQVHLCCYHALCDLIEEKVA